MSERNRMVRYETEKRKLQTLELPPEEYGEAVKALAARLKI